MEHIKVHRKYKGLDFAFSQTVVRGKHGRFKKNPLSKQNIPNLMIGILFVSFCIVTVLYMGRMMQDVFPSRIISPIP